MRLLKLFLLTIIATLIPGQLIRFDFSSGAVTLSDLLITIVLISFFLNSFLIKKSLIIPKSIFTIAFLFILSALSSIILALNFYTFNEILIASFFLLRFFAYFLLSLVVYNTIKKEEIIKWIHYLLLIGFVFTLLGIVQLIIFPDISSLQIYGWDPHQMRLVSTTLDPNYTGGIIAILASFSTALYLFKSKKIYLFLTGFLIIALILTFSRSAYLALLVSMIVIGLIKSPRIIILILTVFILAFTTISQARERIIGAFLIDETATARIESWQKALVIFSKNPVFGVGFNTYRYAQEKYDFFALDNPQGGHSGAGSDSSFLFVAATTGIFGTFFFLLLMLSIIKNFIKKSQSNYLKLGSIASFTGLLVHTQFVNSFFFPQTMLLLWFIVGLNLANEN